jgi:hypothetical protein
MLVALIPLIVLVVGLLLWALGSRPIINKAGEYWFVIGSFFVVWQLAKVTLRFP